MEHISRIGMDTSKQYFQLPVRGVQQLCHRTTRMKRESARLLCDFGCVQSCLRSSVKTPTSESVTDGRLRVELAHTPVNH